MSCESTIVLYVNDMHFLVVFLDYQLPIQLLNKIYASSTMDQIVEIENGLMIMVILDAMICSFVPSL